MPHRLLPVTLDIHGFSCHHRLIFPVLSLAYPLPSQLLSSERLVLPTVRLPHTCVLIFSSVLSAVYSAILLLLELFKEQGSLVLSVLYHLVFFRTINPILPFVSQNYVKVFLDGLPITSLHDLALYFFSRTCCQNHFQHLLYLTQQSLLVLFFTFLMPVCCSNCAQASPLLGERSMMERFPPLSYPKT